MFIIITMTAKKMLMLPLVVVAFLSPCLGISNEVDYGNWNYRDGAENVNVANIRSITRVLDAWGKRIFKDIKTLLHSQPSDLLPDYSRVRPLSESLNDLFREVSHLQKRITDLNNRLATLEPFLRHHGYREEGEDGEDGKEPPQGETGAGTILSKYQRYYKDPELRPTVVRVRRVRVNNEKKRSRQVKVKERGRKTM